MVPTDPMGDTTSQIQLRGVNGHKVYRALPELSGFLLVQLHPVVGNRREKKKSRSFFPLRRHDGILHN